MRLRTRPRGEQRGPAAQQGVSSSPPDRLTVARAILPGAVTAFGAGFSAVAVIRHHAFESGRFDLGNMVQAVWSTAHGRPLEVTNLQGEQVSRLASHVDPLLAAFAAPWLLWPSPSMLLVAQALAVALGAFPVFWLAHEHLESTPAALGFAAAYLLYPPVQWLPLDDFHAVALACPLLLFAFWYLEQDRLAAFALFAVPATLAKEEIGLVVAAMGLWYALSRRRLWTGGVIAGLGIAWVAVAVAVVIPASGKGESAFYGRYEEIGGSPAGIVETAVTDPGQLFSTAFDERGVEYLAALALPLAGFMLFAPTVLLVALPELAINLLASPATQTSIHFHYTAGVIPGLVVASVLGAGRIARRRPVLAAPIAVVAVAAALVATYLDDTTTIRRVTEHDEIAERGLELIPGGAPVSATNTLGAHLSERRRVLSFPLLADAEWIAIDEQRPSLGDRLDPPEARARIAAVRRDAAWKIVFDEGGILVLRRR